MEQIGKKPVFSREAIEVDNQQLYTVQHSRKQQNTSQSQLTGSSRSWWYSPFLGYASSLLLVAVAFLINWLQIIGTMHIYLVGVIFVIGTFLIAWMWGTVPALLSLVVGLVCVDYLVLPPLHTFSFDFLSVLVDLMPFVVLQLLILWLIAKQKKNASRLFCAQQEIARYAEKVAEGNQRLTENNQALAQSNARLEQADRVKDQFLSMASHELRTPVTSIQGHVQLLLRRLKRQSAKNPEWLPVYDSLGKVHEQTLRLTDLVNDLLDINTLRSGKMPVHLAPCDLRSLCRQVVEEQQALAGRSIDLRLPADPVIVQIDNERISQVVSNLVTNALKYSPANTLICVEASQRLGETVLAIYEALLAVHNEGPVLSKEQQEPLFEPFYRSPEAQSSATPGWGLGLAISKEIVKQHGGRIWVESSAEKGTTFFVALPLLKSPEAHSPETRSD